MIGQALVDKEIGIPLEAIAALGSLRNTLEGRLPSAAAFGIGAKLRSGSYIPQLALIVFLPQKIREEDLLPDHCIPPVWDGFVTDVVQSNPVLIGGIINDNKHYNPLLGGVEISTSYIGDDGLVHNHVGTLGCAVQQRSNGTLGFLTCHHVAPQHEDVWQPEEGTGTLPYQSSLIGKSGKSIPNLSAPFYDCARVDPNGTRGYPEAFIQDIGKVYGSASYTLFEKVRKRGRTTGLTDGVLVAAVLDNSTYNVIRLVVAGEVDPLFCWHGDSGSAVVNVANEVTGLLYAMDLEQTDDNGNPTAAVGWMRPIDTVRDALDIEIAVRPPVITQINPNTALGVLANGGWIQIDGWGFDSGCTVTFGGVEAVSIVPVSPRRLIVVPPVQLIAGQVDVLTTNSIGEQSMPSSAATFSY